MRGQEITNRRVSLNGPAMETYGYELNELVRALNRVNSTQKAVIIWRYKVKTRI